MEGEEEKLKECKERRMKGKVWTEREKKQKKERKEKGKGKGGKKNEGCERKAMKPKRKKIREREM